MSIETLRAMIGGYIARAGSHGYSAATVSVDDLEAILAHLQPSPVLCEVDELRAGEMNDGELDSRDLLIEGRGITVLINSGDGTTTYSLRVDGKLQRSGLLWKPQPSPDLRGLVEQWRQRSANESWLHTEGRAASFAFDQCANDLEAAIATMPKPK